MDEQVIGVQVKYRYLKNLSTSCGGEVPGGC